MIEMILLSKQYILNHLHNAWESLLQCLIFILIPILMILSLILLILLILILTLMQAVKIAISLHRVISVLLAQTLGPQRPIQANSG